MLDKNELSKFEDDMFCFSNVEQTERYEEYDFTCKMTNGKVTNGKYSIIKEESKEEVFHSFTYRADEITNYIQIKMTAITNYLLEKMHEQYKGRKIRTVVNRKIIQNIAEWKNRQSEETIQSYLNEIKKIHSDLQTEKLDKHRYKDYPMVLNGFGKDILYLCGILKELGYADFFTCHGYGDYFENPEVIPHLYIVFNEQKYQNLNGNTMVDIVLYWGEQLKKLGFNVFSSCHPQKFELRREIILKANDEYDVFNDKLNRMEEIKTFPPITKREIELYIESYKEQMNKETNETKINQLKYCLYVFEIELQSRI